MERAMGVPCDNNPQATVSIGKDGDEHITSHDIHVKCGPVCAAEFQCALRYAFDIWSCLTLFAWTLRAHQLLYLSRTLQAHQPASRTLHEVA